MDKNLPQRFHEFFNQRFPSCCKKFNFRKMLKKKSSKIQMIRDFSRFCLLKSVIINRTIVKFPFSSLKNPQKVFFQQMVRYYKRNNIKNIQLFRLNEHKKVFGLLSYTPQIKTSRLLLPALLGAIKVIDIR